MCFLLVWPLSKKVVGHNKKRGEKGEIGISKQKKKQEINKTKRTARLCTLSFCFIRGGSPFLTKRHSGLQAEKNDEVPACSALVR